MRVIIDIELMAKRFFPHLLPMHGQNCVRAILLCHLKELQRGRAP
jgi:hypothetical protein